MSPTLSHGTLDLRGEKPPGEGVVPVEWVWWVVVVVGFWWSMGAPNFFVRGGSF